MAHFFISYTGTDRAWAEWIAWQLEAEGYQVVVQAWDFRLELTRFRGRKTADEILDSIATYCQRINDSGH